jgi:hypothetical protein
MAVAIVSYQNTGSGESMTDGGVVALTGFLYQLLGSARELTAPDVRVYLEPPGEDALVSCASRKTLIQFKYSARRRKVAPKELAEILTTLHRSTTELGTKWKLVSNRALSAISFAFLCGKKQRHKHVSATTVATIRRHRTKLTVESADFAEFSRTLLNRGREFGLTDAEITSGANRLVGALLQHASQKGPIPLERDALDEWLTDIPKPASLVGRDRASEISGAIESLAKRMYGVESLDQIVPRSALTGVLADPNVRVSVITGPGGCGKSLAVLRAIRDHTLASGTLGGILISRKAKGLQDIIADWRSGNTSTRAELLELSLDRLRIANFGLEPWVLVVGIDGLDERRWHDQARHQHVCDLIEAVRPSELPSRVPVKLVLTCRHMGEIEDYVNESGFGDPIETFIEEISLGSFTEAEFRSVWAHWFTDLAVPHAFQQGSPSDFEVMGEADRGTAGSARISEALRYPVLLGCFRRLAPDQRRRLLDGDEMAWNDLIRSYVKWFIRKAGIRHRTQRSEATQILRACAIECDGTTGILMDREEFWIRPARDAVGCDRAAAVRLFDDAVTSGLVETQIGSFELPPQTPILWQWRHKFVPEYLATLPC